MSTSIYGMEESRTSRGRRYRFSLRIGTTDAGWDIRLKRTACPGVSLCVSGIFLQLYGLRSLSGQNSLPFAAGRETRAGGLSWDGATSEILCGRSETGRRPETYASDRRSVSVVRNHCGFAFSADFAFLNNRKCVPLVVSQYSTLSVSRVASDVDAAIIVLHVVYADRFCGVLKTVQAAAGVLPRELRVGQNL